MKITTQIESAVLQLTREQLMWLLTQDSKTNPAGIFRASVDALRSAVRTYLRTDRLNEAQLTQAKGAQ